MRISSWILAAVLASVGLPAPASAAPVPNPTVTGPIGDAGIRGYALWDSWYELGPLGYTEDEYFVSGTARAEDGTTAGYTTRIIVTRPIAPSRWNGMVLLDWANVTAQFENAVDSIEAHDYLRRDGWAYVHVSAQAEGICCTPLTPKVWDPVRYEALDHPGEDFDHDIFSQVARAIDRPRGIDPLAGLPQPRRLVAAGQSQSANRLFGYVQRVQPSAGVIDGFLIHSGGDKRLRRAPAVPVLHLLSDAEASPEAPNQTRHYRLWEVAGTAHSDFWVGYHQEVGMGPRFFGAPKQPAAADEDLHDVAGNYGERPHPMHATCILAGSAFPARYAVSAALEHLERWVKRGIPAPRAPRFRFDGEALARDEFGNAVGGLRLPPIDVPVATYVSDACALGGSTVPFSEVQLRLLYPTHQDYYRRMVERTRAAVRAGYLLAADARDLLARACSAKVRWQEAGSACG